MTTRRLLMIVAFAALLSEFAMGCATRKVTIVDEAKLKVELRHRRGETLDFDHPVQIAPVRLSHILSRIDIRLGVGDGQRRVPAIPLETLELLAQGLAKGLQQAKPDQEVVVLAIRRAKRMGLFDHRYITSFVAYVKQNTLYLHLSRSDWELPKNREKRMPVPQIGQFPMDFRIVADQSMERVDQQALAIDWRSTLFDRPTRTRVSPSGKLQRRVILMEDQSELDEDGEQAEPEENLRPDLAPIPTGVSPATLRALADLEEQRQRGTITEAQYARRRLAILEAEASR